MMALALTTLFALCTLVSLVVLVDSGLRAVAAWQRLRGELRTISGMCAAQLAQPGRAVFTQTVRFQPCRPMRRAAA